MQRPTTMIFSHYKRLLTKRPLLTKAATAGTLMAASDATCQAMESSTVDWERAAHVGITGLVFTGPMAHGWYQVLERWVPPPRRAATPSYHLLRTALAHRLGPKLLLDALLFSPVDVAGYFGVRSILEQGGRCDGVQDKLQSMWMPALTASWYFWPAANVM